MRERGREGGRGREKGREREREFFLIVRMGPVNSLELMYYVFTDADWLF